MDDFTLQLLNQVHELTSEEVENSPSNFYKALQQKLVKQSSNPSTNPEYIDISWIGYIYKKDPIYTLLQNHYESHEKMLESIPGALETESRLFFVYEYTSNGNNILESLFKKQN